MHVSLGPSLPFFILILIRASSITGIFNCTMHSSSLIISRLTGSVEPKIYTEKPMPISLQKKLEQTPSQVAPTEDKVPVSAAEPTAVPATQKTEPTQQTTPSEQAAPMEQVPTTQDEPEKVEIQKQTLRQSESLCQSKNICR